MILNKLLTGVLALTILMVSYYDTPTPLPSYGLTEKGLKEAHRYVQETGCAWYGATHYVRADKYGDERFIKTWEYWK